MFEPVYETLSLTCQNSPFCNVFAVKGFSFCHYDHVPLSFLSLNLVECCAEEQNAVRFKIFEEENQHSCPGESVQKTAYRQMFIDYLHTQNPYKLKFFNECGLKLPLHGRRLYGSAPVGERCVEFICYHNSPNITVNLLAGLNGVEYLNLEQGASDTVEFLQFFGEAGNAGNIETGRPALEVGDIVVMDNCPTHHFAGGQVLKEWLNDRNIEVVYTPTYLPDFNPVEFVFNKIRSGMCYELWELTNKNLELAAIKAAVDHITPENVVDFFKYTSYIDV